MNGDFSRLDRDSLVQLIEANPEPISLDNMQSFFHAAQDQGDDKEILLGLLKTLQDEGVIKKTRTNHYVAQKPLSDLVTVRVTRNSKSGVSNSFTAKLVGANDNVNHTIHLSNRLQSSLQREVSNEKDFIAVVRRSGKRDFENETSPLVVSKLVAPASEYKSLVLSACFNPKAKGALQIGSLGEPIHVHFSTASGQKPKTKKHQYFPVQLTGAVIDPHKPSVKILPKRKIPQTNDSVYQKLLDRYNVIQTYSQQAIDEANQTSWQGKDIIARRDLTDEALVAIDPEDAKDHDDVLLVAYSDAIIDGQQAKYRTLTAIADIPAFVPYGSHMDREAKARGQTHYSPNGPLHMFPPQIASRASLKSGQKCPVIYSEKFWDEKGEMIGSPVIGLGVINKQKVLSYDTFNARTQSGLDDLQAYRDFTVLAVNRHRKQAGLKHSLYYEDIQYNLSPLLVQSAMHDMNVDIAIFLDQHDAPFLRRVFSVGDNEVAYQQDREALHKMGYDAPQSPYDFDLPYINNLFNTARANYDSRPVRFVRQEMLRPAYYTHKKGCHLAIGEAKYAHATSPIRRYPDVVNLRSVHAVLGNHSVGHKYTSEELDQIADSVNHIGAVSRNMSKDLDTFHNVNVLASSIGEARRMTVRHIRDNLVAFDIDLAPVGMLRKNIHVHDLPEDWALADNGRELVYKGEIFIPEGEPVKATITHADPQTGIWGFDELKPRDSTLKKHAEAHCQQVPDLDI